MMRFTFRHVIGTVKNTEVPAEHQELVSTVSIHCWGLAMYFDNLSNSRLECQIPTAVVNNLLILSCSFNLIPKGLVSFSTLLPFLFLSYGVLWVYQLLSCGKSRYFFSQHEFFRKTTHIGKQE